MLAEDQGLPCPRGGGSSLVDIITCICLAVLLLLLVLVLVPVLLVLLPRQRDRAGVVVCLLRPPYSNRLLPQPPSRPLQVRHLVLTWSGCFSLPGRSHDVTLPSGFLGGLSLSSQHISSSLQD